MQTEDKRPIALRVRNVSKKYRLGEIGGKTLQHELQTWWAKKRGKPDPNTVIGQESMAIGTPFFALKDIDLTVREGETLGIIGRNGAGKSTLLKLLCRITAPTKGTIDLYGRITSMLEVGTGFNGEMTGRENIYMNGAILGMSRAEVDSKMDQIIAFSEVGQFIDTPVKRYSSGMYVKLGFSVAMHLDSEIMIMDEVLAVGDVLFQTKCIEKMREAASDQGKTVLYVSHNMDTVRRLCKRCIVLAHGEIIYDGDTEQAIRIYMDMNKEQDDTLSIVYPPNSRSRWPKNPAIRMRKAMFLGKEEPVFLPDEKMRLSLSWKALRDIPKAGLRIELLSLDDIPQGSYYLSPFYTAKAGMESEAEFELDLSVLAPSSYEMRYSFFTMDFYGYNIDLECRRGLRFRIDKSPVELEWDVHNWGSHILKDVELTKIVTVPGEGQDSGKNTE